jgi:hypothetical protein
MSDKSDKSDKSDNRIMLAEPVTTSRERKKVVSWALSENVFVVPP